MIDKSSVVIVDVQDIIRKKIIRYIDVLPAVAVNIGYYCPMAKSVQGNASLAGNIMKNRVLRGTVPIILIQPPRAAFDSFISLSPKPVWIITGRSLIHCQVHIQVAIIIIIKKAGHGRLNMNVQAIFSGRFCEMGYTFLI